MTENFERKVFTVSDLGQGLIDYGFQSGKNFWALFGKIQLLSEMESVSYEKAMEKLGVPKGDYELYLKELTKDRKKQS